MGYFAPNIKGSGGKQTRNDKTKPIMCPKLQDPNCYTSSSSSSLFLFVLCSVVTGPIFSIVVLIFPYFSYFKQIHFFFTIYKEATRARAVVRLHWRPSHPVGLCSSSSSKLGAEQSRHSPESNLELVAEDRSTMVGIQGRWRCDLNLVTVVEEQGARQ